MSLVESKFYNYYDNSRSHLLKWLQPTQYTDLRDKNFTLKLIEDACDFLPITVTDIREFDDGFKRVEIYDTAEFYRGTYLYVSPNGKIEWARYID